MAIYLPFMIPHLGPTSNTNLQVPSPAMSSVLRNISEFDLQVKLNVKNLQVYSVTLATLLF